ncbi:uncharacterized protein LOC129732708 [Wyeomyia smithii]|uniref:uncharacterized protein LOC129732708 n=1 Tax=Wyeomyia smithii TaxID=174621 RepID=UPI002467D6D3|nr:uncharacterized protein LOC129732708 [Wyeomyia smithii]
MNNIVIIKEESASAPLQTNTTQEQRCCAPGCETREITNGVILYPFPDPDRHTLRHRIWKQLLLISGDVSSSDRVCSLHFTKESFTFNKDYTRTNVLRSDAFPCATSKFILPLEQRQLFAGMKIGAPTPLKRKRKKPSPVETIEFDSNSSIPHEEMLYIEEFEDHSNLIVEENILYEELE